MYDAGVNDDTLALLYQANTEVHMAVKTPAVQVDNIGQESMKAGHFYLYKDILPIGFLGLVDDIVGITEAGHKALQLNTFINQKTAAKKTAIWCFQV